MRWKALELTGWGRSARAATSAARPERLSEVAAAMAAAEPGAGGLIAYGGGRSYGDAALNHGGRTLLTGRLDRLLAFDPETGELAAEPGVTFADLLATFLPRGFLAPVSPGTGFTTLGGAVANDVHGKNHEAAGSFGDHLLWLDILLPSGEVVRASPEADRSLFEATVGGIGLTGVIVALGLRLVPVPSNAVWVRERRMADLDAFLAAFDEAPAAGDMAYSVGWVDALAGGRRLGRGLLETAEPAGRGVAAPPPRRRRRVPVDLPAGALNRMTVGAFNALYRRRVPAGVRERRLSYARFLYPLDGLADWNRLYGRRGFYQFQCAVPRAGGRDALVALLQAVGRAGAASFLGVLKALGGPGRGCLSFPMPGYTLALDIPRRPGTAELLGRLERIALQAGGRLYLAKDAVMAPESFAAMYPRLGEFRETLGRVDAQGRMASDMARRLRIREAAR